MSLDKSKTKDMQKRLNIINKSNNIIYISIHANAFTSSVVHGAQTFYKKDNINCKNLASSIMGYLKSFDLTNKRDASFIFDKYIIDNASIDGCIVELGFLSNDNDLAMLTNNDSLQELMYRVYLGILSYLNNSNSQRS